MTSDQELNADAIYAALVWMRNYAESQEGEADFRGLMEDRSDKIDMLQSVVDPSGGTFRPIPKFEYTAEFCEEIYPSEPVSVEAGLGLAVAAQAPG